MNCVYCTVCTSTSNTVASANEHKFLAFMPHPSLQVVDGNGDIDDDDDGFANNDDDDEQQFHDIMMYS